MAEWYVSDSDTERDSCSERRDIAESLPANHSELLELLQTLKNERTLHLDCTSILKADERYHKQERRRRKRKRVKNHDSGDILSETTSELKSTHTASTNECRDSRR